MDDVLYGTRFKAPSALHIEQMPCQSYLILIPLFFGLHFYVCNPSDPVACHGVQRHLQQHLDTQVMHSM